MHVVLICLCHHHFCPDILSDWLKQSVWEECMSDTLQLFVIIYRKRVAQLWLGCLYNVETDLMTMYQEHILQYIRFLATIGGQSHQLTVRTFLWFFFFNLKFCLSLLQMIESQIFMRLYNDYLTFIGTWYLPTCLTVFINRKMTGRKSGLGHLRSKSL